MNDQQRLADLEMLARMAARLAGRNPDEHLKMALADVIPFEDVLWRYPDFLVRAETAYEALGGARLVRPEELNGKDRTFDPLRRLGGDADVPPALPS
jgi:hypothetical protein